MNRRRERDEARATVRTGVRRWGLFEVNWSPSQRQLRQFGWLCLIVLPLLGWLWGLNATWTAVLLCTALIIAGLSYGRPQWVRPLFVGLILLAAPIGMIVGEIAMLAIFLAIFLPIGLFFRLVQRDALQLRLDKEAKTYWQTKAEPKDVASYYRRY